MEDLILCDSTGKKKKIIHNIISFECSIGRYSYSDNDFILKIPFSKDEIFEIGEWICYGNTEFCGKILSYEVDIYDGVITYRGLSLRGILAHMSTVSWGTKSGSMASLMSQIIQLSAINSWASSKIVTSNATRNDSFSMSIATTNGLGFAMYLSLHDKIIKTASKELAVPQKSHFSFSDGKIYIKFLDAKTFIYDSSKVKVKYSVNKNMPNVSTVSRKGTGENPSVIAFRYLDADGGTSTNVSDWIIDSDHALDEISIISGSSADEGETGVVMKEAIDHLLEAQEQPSVEIELLEEEAEVDDVIVASISELGMKVTKKVVAQTLKISNGIPKITYELEA